MSVKFKIKRKGSVLHRAFMKYMICNSSEIEIFALYVSPFGFIAVSFMFAKKQ